MKLFKKLFLFFIAFSSALFSADSKNREGVGATLTLQKYNLFLQPVEKPFKIKIKVEREGEKIILTLPSIHTSLKKDLFPLGGFIETIAGSLPIPFRPTSGMPVTFEFSKSNMTGYLDRFGQLTIARDNLRAIRPGPVDTHSTTVSYSAHAKAQITRKDFPIAPGLSRANIPPHGDASLAFDYGDYQENKYAFRNNILYAAWADNSISLSGKNQLFKNQALAKIEVSRKGVPFVFNIVNLSRTPNSNGAILPKKFTYAESSSAIDPTDESTIFVVTQQRRSIANGFILHRSFDGGNTWEFTKLAFNDSLPKGGTDLHIGFDRFGGSWISYIGPTKQGSNIHLIYSSDKGKKWSLVQAIQPLPPYTPPPPLHPAVGLFDRASFAIGPDAVDHEKDVVWIAANYLTQEKNRQKTPSQLFVFGLRILGLGEYEVAPKCYACDFTMPKGAIPSIDVGRKGEVALALLQESPDTAAACSKNKSSPKKHGLLSLSILKNGLANDQFSDPRPIALTSIPTSFLAAPHRKILANPTVAFDRSYCFIHRIYVTFHDKVPGNDPLLKPYLTWSDDLGKTWAAPIRVSNDFPTSLQIYPTIAVDPDSGRLALTWLDSRDHTDPRKVRLYGTILDPYELPNPSKIH